MRNRTFAGARAVAVAALLSLSACTAMETREPAAAWSDEAPAVRPEREPRSDARGRVVVRTQPADNFLRGAETATRFRGYRIYDRLGKTVYECSALFEQEDVRWLPEGRYVALSTVRVGTLTYRQMRVQFYVEAHETTVVDLTAHELPVE